MAQVAQQRRLANSSFPDNRAAFKCHVLQTIDDLFDFVLTSIEIAWMRYWIAIVKGILFHKCLCLR